MGFVENVHLRLQGSVNKTNNVNFRNISAVENFRAITQLIVLVQWYNMALKEYLNMLHGLRGKCTP